MALGFGYESWLGAGKETAYGTPVTRTKFLELNSESLAAEDDVINGNSVYNWTRDVDNYTQAAKTVGGGISFDLRQEGAEIIFLYALGGTSTASPGTGDAKTHTFTMSESLPTGLTLEVNRDVTAFLYHGCKINQLTLNGDNTGIVTVDLDIIAEDEGTAAASTPSFSTSDYWTFDKAELTYNSGTQKVTNWTFNINNNEERRYLLGTKTTNEPVRAGKAEITGEMTVEFDSVTNWTAFNSAGTAAFEADYSGDAIEGTILYGFQVNCPKIRFSGGVPSTNSEGKYTQTIPFVAYSDGTIRPTNIVITNTVASV